MTPAEALASALQRASNSDGNLYAYAEHLPDDILAALDAAGFVVAPIVATADDRMRHGRVLLDGAVVPNVAICSTIIPLLWLGEDT